MKVLQILGAVGKFALAGLLILGHLIMNCIGVIICAITNQ